VLVDGGELEYSIPMAFFILVVSANDFQRQDDEDEELVIGGPETSRLAKRRATKQREAWKKK
jgi:hypothetical protein